MNESGTAPALGGATVGPLSERFLSRSVGTLNIAQPIAVAETSTLREVLGLLRAHRVGCVLVTDTGGVLRGLFSERDWILKVADNLDPATSTVAAAMTPGPRTVTTDTPISHALHLMSAGGFRHLPIVDSEGRPVGIVSVKDVVDRLVALHAEALLAL